MQHTDTTTANTIQTIIDKFFDELGIDTIEKEIYECFYLAETQSDPNVSSFKRSFEFLTTLRATLNFITELERFSSPFDSRRIAASIPTTTVKQNIVFPANNGSELQKLINGYYKKQTARQITFLLWDNYVSAIGNDKAKKWTPYKQSNTAFAILHLNEMLLDLERFSSNGVCLS